MERTTLFILLAVLADGLAGLTGGLLSERWLKRHLSALVAFAAGALIGAVFLEILPEAVEAAGTGAFRWALASFLALTFVEWFLGPHHHDHSAHAPGHPHHHDGLTSAPSTVVPSLLAADALHNLGDGAAVAAAFLASPEAGLAAALAVIAHELPQEVGDYALLRAAGLSRVRALLALGAVQLTALAGAGAVLLGSQWMDGLEGIILALASGTFLYIGATDLLPELRRIQTPGAARGRLLGFLLGLALVATVGVIERHVLGAHG
ncbi:ZIP family metal transporter [Archangium lansingense]|uniref:ZIP family metal transporter n=1 Tax=Archangium lansingense TaxID=2995310 RepID=A0ABT3ZXM0_9BACT|nr:ZIP family metal transporter [Archangium lansinium]MCY1074143.1 ZIP family metal transporter [Archangium lansinium]